MLVLADMISKELSERNIPVIATPSIASPIIHIVSGIEGCDPIMSINIHKRRFSKEDRRYICNKIVRQIDEHKETIESIMSHRMELKRHLAARKDYIEHVGVRGLEVYHSWGMNYTMTRKYKKHKDKATFYFSEKGALTYFQREISIIDGKALPAGVMAYEVTELYNAAYGLYEMDVKIESLRDKLNELSSVLEPNCKIS